MATKNFNLISNEDRMEVKLTRRRFHPRSLPNTKSQLKMEIAPCTFQNWKYHGRSDKNTVQRRIRIKWTSVLSKYQSFYIFRARTLYCIKHFVLCQESIEFQTILSFLLILKFNNAKIFLKLSWLVFVNWWILIQFSLQRFTVYF